MELQFWAATDTGVVRDHNEDNFLVDQNLQLFVVCDGMGGHAAGEVASAICVKTVREVIAGEKELLADLRDNPDDEFGAEKLKAVLERAVETGNARIWEMAQEDPERKGMGTTCTALVLVGNRGFVGHVGDSRMYRLRDDELEQVTDDHSLLNEMIRQGKVPAGTTEEEFDHQNAVTRAVGVRQTVDVDAFSIELEPDDRLLMCSDGLSEYLGDAVDFAGMMGEGEPKDVTGGCIEFARESGGKDNITVVVIDCGPEADESVREEPSEDRGLSLGENALEVIGQTPYFHYLSAAELERLLRVTRGAEVEAGEQVIGEHEDNDRLFVVLEGAVSLSLEGEEVAILERGQHFGEMALIDAQEEDDRNMVAEAVEDARLLVVGRDDFVGLFQRSPKLAVKLLWNFVQVFADRLKEAPANVRYALGTDSADLDSISEVTETSTVDEQEIEEMARGDRRPPEADTDDVSGETSLEIPAGGSDEETAGEPEQTGGSDQLEVADRDEESGEEPATVEADQNLEDADSGDAEIEETGRLKGEDLPPVGEFEETAEASDAEDEPAGSEQVEAQEDVEDELRETEQLHVEVGEDEQPSSSPEDGSSEAESDPEQDEPSVQLNVPGESADPSVAEPEREDDGTEEDEDLRATVQLNWDEKDLDLDRPRSDSDSPEADGGKLEAGDGQDGEESARDKLDSLTDSGNSLRDELRERIAGDSTPQAGVLQKPGEDGEDESAASDGSGAATDQGDQPAVEGADEEPEGQGDADQSDEEDEPKVLVSSELMTDSDEE